RARRDDTRAREGVEIVRRACVGDANVMDAVLEAARRDVTLGEICRVFRDVFGEYHDPAQVSTDRLSRSQEETNITWQPPEWDRISRPCAGSAVRSGTWSWPRWGIASRRSSASAA